ncbi:hypothetical protein M011DRAFT_467781 [Sporormia fimetaria CBS 119925]|uniref:Zn(2)-C6 fungal-type domain-containing protein n=1 Tax=Sporormia fimetaria CBS 119925 TaxID=1340428 RepID=A0A6A6VC21_9PLEO|nr:hypothetical protein M011DRAFT_467781 [Sporormia fimetaria CBS 119925]
MSSAGTDSPDETFFNDLSQQAPKPKRAQQQPLRANGAEGAQDDATNRPKRIACILCRKRKLRCDGARPTCGTCGRLSHDCAYDEARKKSGPKRGYVKLLEARLQQVETLLKNKEAAGQNGHGAHQDPGSAYVASTLQQGLPIASELVPVGFPQSMPSDQEFVPPSNIGDAPGGEGDSWEMIGLGLDEPLPPQEAVDELYQIYFSKIHPSIPVIHKPRFLAAMNLAPHMRPPVCLRYSMWALAASVTDKYEGLQEHFYERARKYAQMDEMRGHGEATITVAHCQAWIILCTFEFKQMYFPRAWLSAGRAVRLAQMMQLHRMDGVGLDVKQCLAPCKDWTEREERRRTFWMAFCVDRFASIGTGWPMTIDEQDIMTNLPASEEAYEKSRPMPTVSLAQAMSPNGATKIEPFAGVVLAAALFGRNLLHLHRPGEDDVEQDLNGGFWIRHRAIEGILLNTALSLPDALRLPEGVQNPNVVFMNMALHTSAICLHQAAIFKADKHRLPLTVSNESKVRCVTAAAEIATVMRLISHMDLSTMNPYISFCIYVAARVFVQYLRTRPKDQQMNSTLQFLLQAMQALKRKNPLTGSFLAQLDVDLEGAGLAGVEDRRNGLSQALPGLGANACELPPLRHGSSQLHTNCVTVLDISDSQSSSSGNGDAAAARPRPNDNTPAPPYYINKTQVRMESVNASIHVPSQTEPGFHLPSRARSNDMQQYSSSGSAAPDDNEMDMSADDNTSPSTAESLPRTTSGPHVSYSPSQPAINLMMGYHPGKRMSNQMPPVTNGTAAFFSAPEEAFQAGLYNAATPLNGVSMHAGFATGSDWDIGGMGAGSTGMTPMSDERFNQLLESMPLGWDSFGPRHGPG